MLGGLVWLISHGVYYAFMYSVEDTRTHLKDLLIQHAHILGKNEPIVTRSRNLKNSGWLFDLRRILMRSDALEDIGHNFLGHV
jgi:hypothetical protein